MTQHGLLIGIGAYRHIRRLELAAKDAHDVRDALVQGGYDAQHVHVLMDEQATWAGISDALDELAREAKPADTVFVFFAGHGVRSVGGLRPGEYLCAVEANPAESPEGLISGKELAAALGAIRAGRVAVFLDACHAGGLGESRAGGGEVRNLLSGEFYMGPDVTPWPAARAG